MINSYNQAVQQDSFRVGMSRAAHQTKAPPWLAPKKGGVIPCAGAAAPYPATPRKTRVR